MKASIKASEWHEMSTPNIISSIDTAVEVLLKRKVDREWMKLLLDTASPIILKCSEEC